MNEGHVSLVLGGGLAGSMAALELGRAGRRVVVVEKTRGPHHKVCGEFLSGESLHYLSRHDVNLRALGAVPIRHVRLIGKYLEEEAEMPFAALSLTRRRLDDEMLRSAGLAGAEVQRGTHVESLERHGGSWSASLRDGRHLSADDLFLATGKHDVRGWPRPEGTHRGLVAFKMYYRLTGDQMTALGQAVELILFPGGYAGLQPVEDGAANLCLLLDSGKLQTLSSGWEGVQGHLLRHSAHLAARLHGALPLLETPVAAARIPYGHVQRRAQAGLWRIGDQAAVIPSFCGDGMAIALHSAALAVSNLLSGCSPDRYQRTLHAELGRRIWLATKLSQAMVGFPQAALLLRWFPGLLPVIALMTRIPKNALIAEQHVHA